jgi:hypothetical protein
MYIYTPNTLERGLPSDGVASDAAAASTLQLTEGQRERIERNRAMALQRRQAAASSPPTPDVQHISQSPTVTVTPASKEGEVSAGHKKSRLVLGDSGCGQKKARLTMDDGRLKIYEGLDVPRCSAETVADDERAGRMFSNSTQVLSMSANRTICSVAYNSTEATALEQRLGSRSREE